MDPFLIVFIIAVIFPFRRMYRLISSTMIILSNRCFCTWSILRNGQWVYRSFFRVHHSFQKFDLAFLCHWIQKCRLFKGFGYELYTNLFPQPLHVKIAYCSRLSHNPFLTFFLSHCNMKLCKKNQKKSRITHELYIRSNSPHFLHQNHLRKRTYHARSYSAIIGFPRFSKRRGKKRKHRIRKNNTDKIYNNSRKCNLPHQKDKRDTSCPASIPYAS